MLRSNLLKIIGMFVLALLVTGSCMAQSDTARLQGTVTDPQNAAVVGASVTVTNTGTGRQTIVQTNELGYYSAQALPPGNYHVEISLKGFKKTERDFTLQVAQVGVVDFQLEVGEVSETITVEGGSPVVNSQDSAIGDVVVGRQVTELPLNGRNFTQLATLVPGVTRGAPGVATGSNNNAETFRFAQSGGASLAVNGLRAQADNFILDGIDNNDALVATIIFFPPADAIDEFRVQTSVAPAQYGRAGGALVVTTIKSGTNDIHGSAFWFNRNKALNAQDFFDSPGTPTPGFTRNQFGGTIGMPIIKDKLFVFGDYEGLRQSIPGGPEYATVPTDLMRKGDFSELLTTAGTGNSQTYTIYDPTTNGSVTPTADNPNGALAFMGNVIPTPRQNTVGLNYLNAYPEPNCTHAEDVNCFSVFHNYKNVRKLIENWNDFDFRIDYLLNSSNSIFGRFSRGRADQTDTTRLTTLPSGSGSGTNFNHPWGSSIGLTTTINPTVINEFRGGFVYSTYGYLPPQNNVDLCTQLGIVNCNTPLLGGIALIGGYNNQIEYTGDYGSYIVPQTTSNYNDTVTWSKGRHTVKAGVNIIRRDLNLFRPLAGKGYFVLSGNGNQGGGGFAPASFSTGYEVSDLLAGFMTGYQHGTQYGMVGTRNWENGFFVQDDFRVTSRLTLNLGLRYDILTWPVEVLDRQANFDLVTGALVVAGSNGAPRQLIPNDYHNFGPRLGFAYRLTDDGKTVLRGGYGIFYYMDRGGIGNQMAQNPPFGGTNSVTYAGGARITLSGSLPCSNTPAGCTPAQLDATQATGPLPSGNFTNLDLSAPTNVSVIGYLPTNLTPMVTQWNLQLQRQIAPNQSVSLAYVGTSGNHLTRNYNANQQVYDTGDQLYPNLGGSITTQDNRGKSNYNSLQAQYERRFTNGLEFLGAFTWSKAIDDSCGDLDTCAPQLYTNYKIERGLSNQDQDYRLVLSSLYELPFGRGKRFGGDVSKWMDYVIGGWQLNGIYTLQAGLPFSVTVDGTPGDTRADLVGTPSVNPGNIANYINAAAFAIPAKTATGIFIAPGTSARDILRGPGSSNMDLALFKNFPITERVKGQFRLQAYNLTNTPHFSNPDGDLSQGPGVFGVISSVQANSWRQVELGLRFTF
jgi:hypothetical protein